MKKISIFELKHIRRVGYHFGRITDTKSIGFFLSYEKALEIMEEYKHITGFQKFPNNFIVSKYNIICSSEVNVEKLKYVYQLWHEHYVEKYDYDKISYLGFFLTYKEALLKKEQIKNKRKYTVYPEGFEIAKIRVGLCGWKYGFSIDD